MYNIIFTEKAAFNEELSVDTFVKNKKRFPEAIENIDEYQTSETDSSISGAKIKKMRRLSTPSPDIPSPFVTPIESNHYNNERNGIAKKKTKLTFIDNLTQVFKKVGEKETVKRKTVKDKKDNEDIDDNDNDGVGGADGFNGSTVTRLRWLDEEGKRLFVSLWIDYEEILNVNVIVEKDKVLKSIYKCPSKLSR